MKKITLLITLFACLACTQKSNESKTSISEKKIFKGLYSVQMKVDTTGMGEAAAMATGFMAAMQLSMDFSDKDSVIYTAAMGAMGSTEKFRYFIQNDSIQFMNEKKDKYKINKIGDNIELITDGIVLILTPKN